MLNKSNIFLEDCAYRRALQVGSWIGEATEGRSPVHRGRNANKSISTPAESQKPARPMMDRLTCRRKPISRWSGISPVHLIQYESWNVDFYLDDDGELHDRS